MLSGRVACLRRGVKPAQCRLCIPLDAKPAGIGDSYEPLGLGMALLGRQAVLATLEGHVAGIRTDAEEQTGGERTRTEDLHHAVPSGGDPRGIGRSAVWL